MGSPRTWSPSYVRTSLVEGQLERQAVTLGIPADRVVDEVMLAPAAVKRLLEPSEVAAYVRFLCSEAGRSITGSASDRRRLDRPMREGGRAMHERRVVEAIVDVLEAGVRHVFGIPADHTLALYDALAERPDVRHSSRATSREPPSRRTATRG